MVAKHVVIIILIAANLVQTQYITQTTPSQDIWQTDSGHTITPTQSTSYGTIRIGQKMSIEFDVTFHGRSNDPRPGYQENFFRIGHDAWTGGTGCDGGGSRYPSMWLTREALGNMLDMSTSSGIECGKTYALDDYDDINFGILHHIKISLNNTVFQVWITGGKKQDYNRTFPRYPTQDKYINVTVPIWFMSNSFYSTPFNVGSGTFSNIIIKSCIGECTHMQTISPTNPSISPTDTIVKSNESTSTTVIIYIICGFIIICGIIIICVIIIIFAYFSGKHRAQKKMIKSQGLSFAQVVSKPAIKSVIIPENNKDEIKIEYPSKTLRHMDEDIVKEINRNINQTVGIMENDDIDVETVNIVNATQILMEYTDEGEINNQHHFTLHR